MHDFMKQSVGLNYALLNATASALIDHANAENVEALVGGVIAAQKKYIDFRGAVMTKLQTVDVKLQVEQLLNLYQSEKENYVLMQESLTKLLGSIPDDRVIPILINVAKDNSVKISVRSLAFEILGKKRHPLITETFIEMLGDPEQQLQLRDFAIKSIEDVRESRVILALLEALNQGHEEYQYLVNVLAKAMGEYTDPAVIPPLIEIIKNPDFPLETRRTAVRALIKFKDLEAFRQLIPLMETPDGYLLFDEMTALAANIGDPAAFRLLRQAALKAQKSASGCNENKNYRTRDNVYRHPCHSGLRPTNPAQEIHYRSKIL
jgi:HEAT repeat protein